MAYIDFMSVLHRRTERDYLARVNDSEYPKAKAASLAKRWGFDYWDGDRRVNYGGYVYKPGYWKPVAARLIENYALDGGSRVLDIGCGKGFLLVELKKLIPSIEVVGLDISDYALEHAHELVKDFLISGTAKYLPFEDNSFDLAISINAFHNLNNPALEAALSEIERVAKQKYICVESYRNEVEKANLLYWQVTCEQFNWPSDWKWWFRKTGYTGDHSFIFFE